MIPSAEDRRISVDGMGELDLQIYYGAYIKSIETSNANDNDGQLAYVEMTVHF